MQANITEMHLNSINYTATTFGPIPLDLVTKLVNWAFKTAIPFFNEFWVSFAKVTIPNTLFGLFKLSDLNVIYHDNYLELGLTPTFLPPKMAEIEVEFSAWKERVSANDAWFPYAIEIDSDGRMSMETNEVASPDFL